MTWTKSGKWQVQIQVEGKAEYLGTFEDEEDAVCVFDQCVSKLGWPTNFGPTDWCVSEFRQSPSLGHTNWVQPCSEEDEGEDGPAQGGTQVPADTEWGTPVGTRRKIQQAQTDRDRDLANIKHDNQKCTAHFQVGDLVTAEYSNGHHYPATITVIVGD